MTERSAGNRYDIDKEIQYGEVQTSRTSQPKSLLILMSNNKENIK
jgi:hypothetical protein